MKVPEDDQEFTQEIVKAWCDDDTELARQMLLIAPRGVVEAVTHYASTLKALGSHELQERGY
jgi:hypothetical protein